MRLELTKCQGNQRILSHEVDFGPSRMRIDLRWSVNRKFVRFINLAMALRPSSVTSLSVKFENVS
jgi:hypothetical protein